MTFLALGPSLCSRYLVSLTISVWALRPEKRSRRSRASDLVDWREFRRLGLGIALVLFPISQFPSRGFSKTARMFVVLVIVLAISAGSFLYIDALRERFETGDVSLKVGSLAINGSGRAAYWRVTIDSFWESPIWGKGAGSSEGLIESYYAEMRHSHSDYLRVANDYGLIGASLWTAAIVTLLAKLFRSWRRADRLGDPNAQIHLGAFLALVAFVLEMSTDNAMVYVFVVAPLALQIGTSLGTGTYNRA